MARRKTGKEKIRNLQKSNRGSYLASIPVGIIRALGWQERQKIVVQKYGKNRIILSDWSRKKKRP
jgi:hypothetical protein